MSDDRPLDIKDWLHAVVADEANNTTPAIDAIGSHPVCFPHTFLIDREKGRVTCKRCERDFPALDALEYIARDWVNYRINRDELCGDVKRLTETRDALRRQVQNLKAQVKRLEPDAGIVNLPTAFELHKLTRKKRRVRRRPPP